MSWTRHRWIWALGSSLALMTAALPAHAQVGGGGGGNAGGGGGGGRPVSNEPTPYDGEEPF